MVSSLGRPKTVLDPTSMLCAAVYAEAMVGLVSEDAEAESLYEVIRSPVITEKATNDLKPIISRRLIFMGTPRAMPDRSLNRGLLLLRR